MASADWDIPREVFDRYLAATEDLEQHPPASLRGLSRVQVADVVRARCVAAGLDVPEDKIRASTAIVLRRLYGRDVDDHVGPDPDADPAHRRPTPRTPEQEAAMKAAVETVRRGRAGKTREQLTADLDTEVAARGLPALTDRNRDFALAMLTGAQLPVKGADQAAMGVRGLRHLARTLKKGIDDIRAAD